MLRLEGKWPNFAISELNSSATVRRIRAVPFASCRFCRRRRALRVSSRSSDSFDGDLRSKSCYTLPPSSSHIFLISSSIHSIPFVSCSRMFSLRFNTFSGASRAILTFLFQYLLYFTWLLPSLSLGFCKISYSFHSLTTPLSFVPHRPPSFSFALLY